MIGTRRYQNSGDVAAYLKEIHGTPLLSAEEERELARRVAAGDAAARDQLVRANLGLVVHIAKSFARRGLSFEDLVAEGNLGLIRASEGYDGRAGVRFGTYAANWIKQSIRSATIKQGKFVRVPFHAVTAMSKWRKAAAELAETLGREPTEAEIGDAMGLSETKRRLVCQALQAADLIVHGESDGSAASDPSDTMFDGLVDRRERSPEDRLAREEMERRILNRLDRLEAREAGVVRMRFGLDGDKPCTLREIGRKLGLTRERIRQLERKALQTLAG